MSEDTALIDAPHGVQLSRARGWRMPPNTVSVVRGTKWGNPFKVEYDRERRAWVVPREGRRWEFTTQAKAAQAAVGFYEHMVTTPAIYAAIRAELAGKNLACWCSLGEPCHRDVLLRIAATPPPAPTRVEIHVWGPSKDAREDAADAERRALASAPTSVVEHWALTVSVRHRIITEIDVLDEDEPAQPRRHWLAFATAIVFCLGMLAWIVTLALRTQP